MLADDSPFTTDGIGHHGTAPSSWAMKNCDAVLIVGSTMPWFEYYPKPGQARGVQIDMKPDRIGLRYPVEIGLVGGHCRRRRICDADGRRPPFSTICQLRSSSSRTLPRSSSSKWSLAILRLGARLSASSRLHAPAVPMAFAANVLRRYGPQSRRRSVRRGQCWSRRLSTPTRSQLIRTN